MRKLLIHWLCSLPQIKKHSLAARTLQLKNGWEELFPLLRSAHERAKKSTSSLRGNKLSRKGEDRNESIFI